MIPILYSASDIIKSSPYWITTTSSLRLRSTPSTSGTILTSLPNNTQVYASEVVTGDLVIDTDQWIKTTYDGHIGYLTCYYLEHVMSNHIPSHYGTGALSDCLSCSVTEKRNGIYELSLSYPALGLHASDIAPNMYIKAKPNYTDNPQLFRIYKVGKAINGRFDVSAQHISYDMGGMVISSGTASSCAAACSLLQSSTYPFSISTDKSVSATFTITEPSSVRSWFGGKAGSLLDVFGTGEWKYDNYSCQLKTSRGTDRGVEIRYGKNLTDLSQVLDMSNLVTGVIPYYVNSESGAVITGAKVSTGLTLDRDRDIAIDFSQDVNPESATPIATQLSNLATNYINNNNLTSITNSISLDFVQIGELKDRVDLCDTVHIYFEPLGITASAKCISTTWDVLNDRYSKTEFGEPRTDITDTIAAASKKLEKTPTVSQMTQAVNRATELITGNLGGYVVLHDTDYDGEPDEILIMDTADINTATKVWRWNKNGLGYSDTGYSGTYGLAMTADGEIVADFITTGTLNADLIKAGVIEDSGHNSTINMTTGVAILKNLQAKNSFQLVDTSNVRRCWLTYSVAGGTTLEHLDDNGTPMAQFAANPNYGGVVDIYNLAGGLVGVLAASQSRQAGYLTLNNSSAKAIAELFDRADGYGGTVRVNDANGNERGGITASNTGGFIWVQDTSGKTSATMYVRGDGYGGLIKANNASGNEMATLTVDSNGGDIYIKNSSDKKTVEASNYNSAGYLAINDSSGTANAELWNDGGGKLRLKNSSHVQVLDAFTNSTNGGTLQIKNSYGDYVVSLFAGSYNDGSINLYDLNGNNNINLAGHSGNITCVSLTQTSSRKVKENIKPMPDAEARKILELQAVSFDFKNEGRGKDKRGFIAEDVAEILPNLVTPETEDRPASLDYIGMIPYLQGVIKEQEARIKALEDKLNNLGG